MEQRADVGELPGIECIAADARIVVAAAAVDRIVELDIARLPLAQPFVTGIAVHDDEIVVTVRAGGDHGAAPLAARRTTKAVLLARSSHPARFAVEIDQVLSFVRARPKGAEAGAAPGLIGRAICTDGREVAWLDAAWLARALAGGAS